MKTTELAPGAILQQMYLDERMARCHPSRGRFVDLGAGAGQASSVLLRRGWSGVGIDLNECACRRNSETNSRFVSVGSYDVRHADFASIPDAGPADLVVSSMVLEHLDEAGVAGFFDIVLRLLSPSGSLILMVPGSPAHWGIEDEIAGHVRRFNRSALRDTLQQNGFVTDHLVGLTYPISNLLLPVSNLIVGRAEHQRLDLSAKERTVLAGDRQVMFKTSYPVVLRWIINPITLVPLHILQKLCRNQPNALVLYAEARPA